MVRVSSTFSAESLLRSPNHIDVDSPDSRAIHVLEFDETATIVSSSRTSFVSSVETFPTMRPSPYAANPYPSLTETSLTISPLGTRQTHDVSFVSKPIPAGPQCHRVPFSIRRSSRSPSAKVSRFEVCDSRPTSGTCKTSMSVDSGVRVERFSTRLVTI